MSIHDAAELVHRVAVANGYRRDTLKYGGKHFPLIHARGVACWLLRNVGELSYPQVARMMGGKHHTTIMHIVRSVNTEIRLGKGPYLDTLVHTIGKLATQ